MNKRMGIVACTVCMGLALTVFGQDTLSDDRIFDTDVFQQTIDAGMEQEKKNKLEYLPGVSFVADAAHYFTIGETRYGSDARFYGKAFCKASRADIGALLIAYTFSYFLYAAADNSHFRNFYRMQSPDPTSLSGALSELHLSFDVKKRVFIRIGDQIIGWGTSYVWSPADFINRQKDQAAVLQPVDVRTGKPGIRLHVPLPSANIFLFTDFSSALKNRETGRLSRAVAQAWRVNGTISGVQVGMTGYAALHRPLHIGFDGTGNLYATDIYGECALGFSKTDDYVPAYAFSIGASRLFGREKTWTCRTEFYYSDTGYADTRISTLLPGSFTPFYSGKYYAYGEVSVTKLFSVVTNAALFGFINLADRSFSPSILCTIDIPGVIPFSPYLRYFGGKKDREFTYPYGGPVWQAGLRILVEW